MRRLELGGDHEVDLDLPLLPGLDVLRVRGAHDGLRLGELLRERAGDEVDLVPRRAGDHEVGQIHAGVLEDAARRPVALDRADVVLVRESLQPRGVEIDDRDLVLFVQRLDDGRADLPGTEEDDLHGDRSLVLAQVNACCQVTVCYLACHSGSSSIPTPSAIRLM